jgi:hypothetical protein
MKAAGVTARNAVSRDTWIRANEHTPGSGANRYGLNTVRDSFGVSHVVEANIPAKFGRP